MVIKVIVIIW